jgi:hypothetical protein
MRTVSSSRADRIVRLRDIVSLGVINNVCNREELIELARRSGTFVTEKGNRPYDYSSIYRYLAALLFLKFDLADNIGAEIVWSPEAKILAEISANTRFTNELAEEEKEVFRNRILRSGANAQFLASFDPTGHEPKDRNEFATKCKPLFLLGIKKRPLGEAGKDWLSDSVAEISLDPDSGLVQRKAVMEFLYTYRLWCLDAELIEEINVKEANRSGVSRNRSHVLYPVGTQTLPTTEEFLDLLYTLVDDPTKPNVVSLPKLLYTLCVDLQMKVDSFKKLLVDTWNTHRQLLHLERGPGILIRGDLASKTKSYSERFGNHRYYINMDGTIRSNLVLRPREKSQ